MTPLVPVLALSGAFCSAAATILIRLGLRGGDALTGYWISLAVGTVGLWAAVLLAGPGGSTRASGVLLFVLSGMVGSIGGRFLRFVSIQKVGAPVGAALMSLNPFIATGLAVLLLGERVTAPLLAGTVVIVAGATLLSLSGRTVGFRPGALAYPLLAATCFGAVMILRKAGLGGVGPTLGFAINVTTALVACTAFMLVARRGLETTRRSLLYFVAAGVLENLGVFLSVVALSVGSVSVVTPLTSTAPVFVLLMSGLFLRGDRAGARVVLGTILIVAGIYLVTAV